MKRPIIRFDKKGGFIEPEPAFLFCLFLASENNRHRDDIRQGLALIRSLEERFGFKVPRAFKMQWITP